MAGNLRDGGNPRPWTPPVPKPSVFSIMRTASITRAN